MKNSILNLLNRNQSGYQNQVHQPETLIEDSDDDDLFLSSQNIDFNQLTEKSNFKLNDLSLSNNCDSKEQLNSDLSVEDSFKNDQTTLLSQTFDSICFGKNDLLDTNNIDEFGFVQTKKAFCSSSLPACYISKNCSSATLQNNSLIDLNNTDTSTQSSLSTNSSLALEKNSSQWLNYLQMHYNSECKNVLTWKQVELRLKRTTQLEQLIVQTGLPNQLRTQVWKRLNECAVFKSKSNWTYEQLLTLSKSSAVFQKNQIISVLPNNVCFNDCKSVGINRLQNLLQVMLWLQRNQTLIPWYHEHLNRDNINKLEDDFKQSDSELHQIVLKCSKKMESKELKMTEISKRWRLELNVPLIAAYLLLTCDEETTFWLLLSIVNEAESCYNIQNKTIQNKESIDSLYSLLIKEHCSRLSAHFSALEVDVWLICNQWIESLFAGWLSSTHLLYRLWDLQFYFGLIVHFQLWLGLLIKHENELLEACDIKQLIRVLGRLPDKLQSLDDLIHCWQIGKERLIALPRLLFESNELSLNQIKSISFNNKHESNRSFEFLASDCFWLLDTILIRLWNDNPCAGESLRIAFRSARLRNGSSASQTRPDKLQVKNIRQTTILMELQETIEAIVRHFTSSHPHLRIDLTLRDQDANEPVIESLQSKLKANDSNNNIVKERLVTESTNDVLSLRQMLCTFSRKVDQLGTSQRRLESKLDANESSSDDGDLNANRQTEELRMLNNQLKAIALIEFKTEQADELHFVTGQMIRILDDRDEHCWIGQINERVGWFPAKFVRLLDESSGEYMSAGDDSVDNSINNLIRGRLGAVLKCVFTHGMRKGLGLFTVHPWMLIEEIVDRIKVHNIGSLNANQQSNRFKSLLKQTFRLPNNRKALLEEEPEVSFVEAVEQINRSHGNIPMDIRLRSWICLALNKRQLDRWFGIYCEMDGILMSKHYHKWSYITSPVVQFIKAHLRILNQLSFHLNLCAELVTEQQNKSPVSKNGIQDMLFKHHLFSWDI